MKLDSRNVVAAAVLAICLASPVFAAKAFAQQTPVGGTTPSTVDIKIEPTWSDGGNAKFKVSFLQHNTNSVQPHIDYDFAIVKDGKVVYSAAKALNQNTLHVAEVGMVTIPYKFDQNGNYVANVTVYGILFTPVTPFSSQLPLTVTPEFPPAMIALGTAGVLAAAVVLGRVLTKGEPVL